MSRIIRLGALLLGAVYSVTAAPMELEKRSVSADCRGNLELFAHYSTASYCIANYNGTASKVMCPGGDCSRVELADTDIVLKFMNSPKTDVTGFIAVDNTNQLIVISWRGSRSIRNWIANLEVIPESITLCPGCRSNTGYWESWLEAQTEVMDGLAQARAQYPDYTIISTGHSLGAAIASLAAGFLRSQGVYVDLYTYGCPKVGFEPIAKFLESGPLGQTYRVTHKYDLIPKITPALLGWRHPSPEYYISSNDKDVPQVNDITVLEGQLNFKGNEWDGGLSVESHLFYFVPMAACTEPNALIWKE